MCAKREIVKQSQTKGYRVFYTRNFSWKVAFTATCPPQEIASSRNWSRRRFETRLRRMPPDGHNGRIRSFQNDDVKDFWDCKPRERLQEFPHGTPALWMPPVIVTSILFALLFLLYRGQDSAVFHYKLL
jgi:hypothetical protein